jgi:uncharacterized protein (TIGR02996 family)
VILARRKGTPVKHNAAFLRDICEHPDDDTPRLIYADWLDERGAPKDRERAEFIRVQCRLETMKGGEDDYWDLKHREAKLLDATQSSGAGTQCPMDVASSNVLAFALPRTGWRQVPTFPGWHPSEAGTSKRVNPTPQSLPAATICRGCVTSASGTGTT